MTTGLAFMLTFCAAVVFIAVIGIARAAYLLKETRTSDRAVPPVTRDSPVFPPPDE